MDEIRKQVLVNRLIEDEIEMIKKNILAYDDVWYLGEILKGGCEGFENLTLEQLENEAKERGLAY